MIYGGSALEVIWSAVNDCKHKVSSCDCSLKDYVYSSIYCQGKVFILGIMFLHTSTVYAVMSGGYKICQWVVYDSCLSVLGYILEQLCAVTEQYSTESR